MGKKSRVKKAAQAEAEVRRKIAAQVVIDQQKLEDAEELKKAQELEEADAMGQEFERMLDAEAAIDQQKLADAEKDQAKINARPKKTPKKPKPTIRPALPPGNDHLFPGFKKQNPVPPNLFGRTVKQPDRPERSIDLSFGGNQDDEDDEDDNTSSSSVPPVPKFQFLTATPQNASVSSSIPQKAKPLFGGKHNPKINQGSFAYAAPNPPLGAQSSPLRNVEYDPILTQNVNINEGPSVPSVVITPSGAITPTFDSGQPFACGQDANPLQPQTQPPHPTTLQQPSVPQASEVNDQGVSMSDSEDEDMTVPSEELNPEFHQKQAKQYEGVNIDLSTSEGTLAQDNEHEMNDVPVDTLPEVTPIPPTMIAAAVGGSNATTSVILPPYVGNAVEAFGGNTYPSVPSTANNAVLPTGPSTSPLPQSDIFEVPNIPVVPPPPQLTTHHETESNVEAGASDDVEIDTAPITSSDELMGGDSNLNAGICESNNGSDSVNHEQDNGLNASNSNGDNGSNSYNHDVVDYTSSPYDDGMGRNVTNYDDADSSPYDDGMGRNIANYDDADSSQYDDGMGRNIVNHDDAEMQPTPNYDLPSDQDFRSEQLPELAPNSLHLDGNPSHFDQSSEKFDDMRYFEEISTQAQKLTFEQVSNFTLDSEDLPKQLTDEEFAAEFWDSGPVSEPEHISDLEHVEPENISKLELTSLRKERDSLKDQLVEAQETSVKDKAEIKSLNSKLRDVAQEEMNAAKDYKELHDKFENSEAGKLAREVKQLRAKNDALKAALAEKAKELSQTKAQFLKFQERLKRKKSAAVVAQEIKKYQIDATPPQKYTIAERLEHHRLSKQSCPSFLQHQDSLDRRLERERVKCGMEPDNADDEGPSFGHANTGVSEPSSANVQVRSNRPRSNSLGADPCAEDGDMTNDNGPLSSGALKAGISPTSFSTVQVGNNRPRSSSLGAVCRSAKTITSYNKVAANGSAESHTASPVSPLPTVESSETSVGLIADGSAEPPTAFPIPPLPAVELSKTTVPSSEPEPKLPDTDPTNNAPNLDRAKSDGRCRNIFFILLSFILGAVAFSAFGHRTSQPLISSNGTANNNASSSPEDLWHRPNPAIALESLVCTLLPVLAEPPFPCDNVEPSDYKMYSSAQHIGIYKALQLQVATRQPPQPTPQPTFNYHAESMFKVTDHPCPHVQYIPEDPSASFFTQSREYIYHQYCRTKITQNPNYFAGEVIMGPWVNVGVGVRGRSVEVKAPPGTQRLDRMYAPRFDIRRPNKDD